MSLEEEHAGLCEFFHRWMPRNGWWCYLASFTDQTRKIRSLMGAACSATKGPYVFYITAPFEELEKSGSHYPLDQWLRFEVTKRIFSGDSAGQQETKT